MKDKDDEVFDLLLKMNRYGSAVTSLRSNRAIDHIFSTFRLQNFVTPCPGKLSDHLAIGAWLPIRTYKGTNRVPNPVTMRKAMQHLLNGMFAPEVNDLN